MSMKGLIQFLKRQVVFQGKVIYEGGLKHGLKFHETADQCDNRKYMDIEVLDFPQLTLTVVPDRHDDWKPVGGVIGYASDGLSAFDSELSAGWALKNMGYNVPVRKVYIDEDSILYDALSPGEQKDGRYFIPSADESAGYLLEWGRDQDAFYECSSCLHLQHTTEFGECEECGNEIDIITYEDYQEKLREKTA